jgi:hypothetical protein
MKRAVIVLAASGLALAACEKDYKAPSGAQDQNVCYQVSVQKDGSPKFIAQARDQKTLEDCASILDSARRRFFAMGGKSTMTGAYNGTFIFLDSSGMSTSKSLNGGRFFAFSRLPDGQLARGVTYSTPPEPQDQGAASTPPASK